MNEELKSCPFCGVNEWQYHAHFSGASVFQCEKCGTIVDECVLNTRPIEDALNARIAELEAEIDQLTAHSDIERQDDKCSWHGDISNFPPVMGSGDGLGW